MDLAKSYDFFKPEELTSRIHIIGCGAVGSTLAENLCRFGIKNITLYDFDIVEPHNIANQMFRATDIGKLKVDAVRDIMLEINPDAADGIRIVPEGYTGQRLSGYVFLAVDNIDLRREIAEKCKTNTYVKAMFDFRISLTDGQHYAADWSDSDMVKAFIDSMQFSHEEVKENEPVSACNIPLSVCPTIRVVVGSGVANFINYVKHGKESLKRLVLTEAFNFGVMAF